MGASSLPVRVAASTAWIIATVVWVVAWSSSAEASDSWKCPGYPEVCQESCTLDPYNVPIYCEGGICVCAAGFDTMSGSGGVTCVPHQPDWMPAFSDHTACPDTCVALAGEMCGAVTCDKLFCPDACTQDPWGAATSSVNSPFDLVPVHGTAPGGEAFMPVWGKQANDCGAQGQPGGTDIDGHPIQSWVGCHPDPLPFCTGIQNSDEGDFNAPSCHPDEGCGDGSVCVSDFTSAYPNLDSADICKITFSSDADPSRIDFPNNVIVYRAPVGWENHGDEDDDYTWNLHSPAHEMYDTDTRFGYQNDFGRVHVEHDSDETIDHFTDDDWGAANKFWRDLRNVVDNSDGNDNQKDQNIRCFLKSFVNPGQLTFDLGTLTCSLPVYDADSCSDHQFDLCGDDGLRDPLAVVVGVPSLDCRDNDKYGTDEIHPAYAVAIRVGDEPSKPERWEFFYRRHGNNGFCGSEHYGRCGSTFRLPLGIPRVPSGNNILTGADVQVEWHAWAENDSPSSGVAVDKSFDLLKGTVLNITLPNGTDGVVGEVVVTPSFDATAPTISCPSSISTTPDLGKCTAAVTFSPTIGDNCSVSAACTSASGSAFPIGTTMDTCTATDQAGLQTSCTFSVTVTAGDKCPHAQGWWKNHTNWPVSSLTLGTDTYSEAQLLSILDNSTNGDASMILGREEIATLLSLASGSDPTPICATIADADAALGALTIPGQIGPKTVLGQRMVSDSKTLDSYNVGKLTPGCTP